MDHFLTPYGDAIKALFARTTQNTKLGLERTEKLLALLGSPHRSLPAIHVAGTNGKGSVVAAAEAVLRANGRRVGRYTSPHLIDFRERITVNGVPIPEAEVLRFLEQWTPTAEKLGATFFEVTTALAFSWLAEQSVDIAVIETGLGGRLDSTNVLTPEVAVVTSIGLDHTDLLGATLPEIAGEKAGIFKRGRAAVIGEADPEIRAVLARTAQRIGAEPTVLLDDSYHIGAPRVSLEGTTFLLRRGTDQAEVTTPLIGRHQARNTTIAIAAVNALGPEYQTDLGSLSEQLSDVHLPGRFQIRGRYVFDVAHNPAGARTVAESLAALDAPGEVTAVLAILRDKDWQGIIRELSPVVDRFIFTTAPSAALERAWDPGIAHAFARAEDHPGELEPDLDRALSRAEQRGGTILVTGSFHTVGDAMSRLQVSPFAA